MNLPKIVLIFSFLSPFSFHSQNSTSKEKNKAPLQAERVSNIIKSSAADTSFLKLELFLAHYDGIRGNLPYFPITHVTDYDQKATPKLSIKKTALVNEAHSAVIKKYYQN